jgi:hypothetical protein
LERGRSGGSEWRGLGFLFIAEHRLMMDKVRVVKTHRGRAWLDGQAVPLSRASKVGSSAAELEEKRVLSLSKRGDVCACPKVFDGIFLAMGEGGW